MSESVALYRKYRPKTFDEVKDQDHIVSVLKGAIQKGTIPHAFLFSGTRGTGKTTLARIFAEAIGTKSIDLYEIDAASNRGIDDIRELKEAVHTLPYESEKKVYIIDEVHMLTKEAFNALLKTLEEPPSHVIFILATTEEEKLLDTIRSRCQVFRFKSPSRKVLKETAIEIAKKEGMTLTPEAAELIAIAADGSFRDALGVTQKVILASGDSIGSADEVATIIGAPKTALLREVIQGLHEKNVEAALSALHKAVADNADMKLFARLLLEHIRAVMLLRNLPAEKESILAAFGEDTQKVLVTIAAEPASPVNSRLLASFLDATEKVSRVSLPYLPLEIVICEHGTTSV